MATTPKKDYYEILGARQSALADGIRKLALLLSIMSLLLGSALSQDSDVGGTVRDAEGHPIPGVSVTAFHHFPGGGAEDLRSKTDDQGHFELKNVGRAVFFVAPKFEVLTHIRASQESSLEVSLKPDLEDHSPATCSAEAKGGKRYGTGVLFLVPQGVKTRRHNGTDTWDLVVDFPHTRTGEQLMLWSGPMLGDGFVPEETILAASSFSQKRFDWRGKSREGKNWRWFSSTQDLIHYESASDAAARFFDRIIDSACERPIPDSGEKAKN
jgi:hypothetical protein